MAGTGDVRDMLGLDRTGPRPKAPKKKKHTDSRPRATGMNREVQALMGDSVPPIALTEIPKYKSKPTIQNRMFKPRHWEQRPFQHGARTDGLTFRHWKRSIPGLTLQPDKSADGTDSADVEMDDEDKDPKAPRELQYEEEFPSEKWNVKISAPKYTDEQYQNLLRVDNWTKTETDYLLDLCRDYDLRWVLISDRYVPEEISLESTHSNANSDLDAMDIDDAAATRTSAYPSRSMEALKSRYYTVAAKMLETETPATTMTQTEFQLWEKMRNFDAKTESMRKAVAEKMYERTKEESEEERVLLEELHRITKNEDDFLKMRRDLYARLEPPPTKRNNGEEQSTAVYQTSGGLFALLQQLLQKEKRLKRPMVSGEGAHGSGSMTPGDLDSRRDKWEKGRHPNQYTNRRDTMDTQNEDVVPQKKGSQSQPNIRTLTPEEELKYGVARPQERLQGGIVFRHERIHKKVQAKSQVQTQKIQQALIELSIPTRLVMPTDKVCKQFERLVDEIYVLLDARKGAEKVTSEVKILEEARRIRLGETREGDEEDHAAPQGQEVDDSTTKLEDESSQLRDGKERDEEAVEDEEDADGEDEGGADEDVDAREENDEDEDEDEDEAGNEESTMQVDEQDEDEDEDEDAVPAFAEEDDEEVEQDDEEEDQEDEVGEERESEGEAEGEESDAEEDNDEEEDQEAASPAEDSDAPSEQTGPSLSHSAVARLHKRSASVVSEASKAGSNRSGMGRKKRR